LVIIAGNDRLVLALLVRRLRRASSTSRGAALAGAWLRLAGRLRPGAGLTSGGA
jgi:hypothetical protein